jgi:hypothetical protein
MAEKNDFTECCWENVVSPRSKAKSKVERERKKRWTEWTRWTEWNEDIGSLRYQEKRRGSHEERWTRWAKWNEDTDWKSALPGKKIGFPLLDHCLAFSLLREAEVFKKKKPWREINGARGGIAFSNI